MTLLPVTGRRQVSVVETPGGGKKEYSITTCKVYQKVFIIFQPNFKIFTLRCFMVYQIFICFQSYKRIKLNFFRDFTAKHQSFFDRAERHDLKSRFLKFISFLLPSFFGRKEKRKKE